MVAEDLAPLYEIGSISKVITGLLLADAVVEGKLSLDDTLASRLPMTYSDPKVWCSRARSMRSARRSLTCPGLRISRRSS